MLGEVLREMAPKNGHREPLKMGGVLLEATLSG